MWSPQKQCHDGLRDSLTHNNDTTTFTWDVNRSIPVVVDDGTYQYLYGMGRIAQVGSSETHYYLADGLGSTLALTDEDGAVVNTYDYDVFGALRASTGSQDNDFTFTGEQVDGSTGLQYLRARYYDMETGGFISRDPLAASPYWTEHDFAYASSNPANLVDPLGLCGLTDPWNCADEAAEYAWDKGRDAAQVGAQCASLSWSCTTDSLALGISVFSTGDRRTGPNGFVYYENCRGLCDVINKGLDLFSPTTAFTPGSIAFFQGEARGPLTCHEYQHYIQSRFTGPLHVPLALTPPFEADAEAAESDKEGHVPFTRISIPGACQ